MAEPTRAQFEEARDGVMTDDIPASGYDAQRARQEIIRAYADTLEKLVGRLQHLLELIMLDLDQEAGAIHDELSDMFPDRMRLVSARNQQARPGVSADKMSREVAEKLCQEISRASILDFGQYDAVLRIIDAHTEER